MCFVPKASLDIIVLKQKMRHSDIILIVIITGFYSCTPKTNVSTGKATIYDNSQVSLIRDIEKATGYRYIYTDTTYTSSTGKEIIIQNGLPKGGHVEGKPYTDSIGNKYFFAAFWTRIINRTNTTLELKLNFPADPFPLSSSPDPYLKLFLPADTMTVDKLSSLGYGLRGIKSFLDTNFNNATSLQKTIKPNEEHFFYITTIAYQAGGPARSAIILKEHELFYRISMGPYGPIEIPCGELVVKE